MSVLEAYCFGQIPDTVLKFPSERILKKLIPAMIALSVLMTAQTLSRSFSVADTLLTVMSVD